ncbi:MAG: alkaline phosphatase family protein [Gaiellaceae bacterium]
MKRITLVALAATALLAPAARTAAPPVPRFAHVLVVVFENKDRGDIAGSSQAPTFARLARQYAGLTGYRAVAHPSLPNYLALVSGSTAGITSDCTSCVARVRSLASTLTAAGRTWKTYAEGLPLPGFDGASAGRYAKKHDPFLYFPDAARQRDRVVPLPQLAGDVRRNRLPDFSLIVPDLCDDMHDCPVATGDAWLRREIVPLLVAPALARSVVFVVFDEGSGSGTLDAIAAGPAVRHGTTFAKPVTHYGLLRTIEDAWGLPRLGRSAGATPITGIWK